MKPWHRDVAVAFMFTAALILALVFRRGSSLDDLDAASIKRVVDESMKGRV